MFAYNPSTNNKTKPMIKTQSTVYPDKMYSNINDWYMYVSFESWRMSFGNRVKNQIHEQIKTNISWPRKKH